MATDQVEDQNIINLEQHISPEERQIRKERFMRNKRTSKYRVAAKKIAWKIYHRLVWPTIDF